MRDSLEQRDRIMERHSHELRAPVQAIVGMAEILLTTPLDREQREYASTLRTAAQHVLNLLDGFGGYAQIERGELPLQMKPLALRRCLDGVVLMMTAAGNGSSRPRIRLMWGAGAPEWILGDELLLRRAWTSLIAGAMVQTRSDVAVELSSNPAAPPGMSTTLVLEVRSSRTPHPPPGLGFSIAASLLGSAGGHLMDLSTGPDLHWRVELPATVAHAEASPATAPVFETSHRVLLAEDNQVNQVLAAKLLQRNRCEVVLAGTGREAVRAMTESGPFDLVLMDLQMPEMDGLEATRQIRHAEGMARRTPIVAMTACAMEGDRERCISAGMDDFLAKPLRWPDLQAMLTRWLPSEKPVARAAGA